MRDFGFGDPCPVCGKRTTWVPNVVHNGVEFGRFVCTNCGAESDFHEISMIVDTKR